MQIKLKYLGFNFNYIPTKRIKKGGILTRYDDITYQKSAQTKNGIYLIYPASKKFQYIKNKCKFLIKMLLKKSVIKVLTLTNLILREILYYHAWSNSYNRLKTLDGLLFRYFKKYLIKKFRNRGIRRPIWVIKKFLICKITQNIINEYTSPYSLKWHPHAEFINFKIYYKQFKKILFLLMPSKIKIIRDLPIVSAILSKSLRIEPYYVTEDKFNHNLITLYIKKKRFACH